MAGTHAKRNDGIERRTKADGSVSYRVLIRRAGVPTISKTFETLADARTYRRRIYSSFSTAKALGQSPLALNKTVGDALDRYERDIMPAHRSQSSEKTFLRHWRKQLSSVRLSELEAVLQDQVEELAKKKGAGSTANRYLGFLRRVIAKARSWKWIDRNPVDEVESFPEGKQRERIVKPDEFGTLLDACDRLAARSPDGSPARQLRTFLTCLYETACRKGEIRFLRWEDVDLVAWKRRRDLGEGMGLALLYGADTKNQTPREVVLLPAMVKILEQHRAEFERKDHPWVFPGRSRFKPAQFDRYFIDARTEAGIEADRRGEQLVMHSLRHSAASEMADGGATEYELMAAGGWKSPSMVRRYVKGSTSQAVAALQKRRLAKE
jgi:integrase